MKSVGYPVRVAGGSDVALIFGGLCSTAQKRNIFRVTEWPLCRSYFD